MSTAQQTLSQLQEKMPNYRAELLENGFVCMKSVFTPEEIEEFRRLAYLTVGEGLTGTDLLSNPHFRNVLMSDRVLCAVRGLLQDKPVYFGESNVRVDGFNGMNQGSIHKDNPDRHAPDGPDWNGEYKVIRFGIYCQDHAKHSEGLTVRKGSHKSAKWNEGKMDYVPSEPGDLVAFYYTTTHCSYSKRLRHFPNVRYASDSVNNRFKTRLYKYIPSRMIVPRDRARIVLYMAFGVRSPHLDRYLDYALGRNYGVKTWQSLQYTEETKKFLEGKDVELIDMSEKAKEIDINSVGGHYQLPY